MGWVFWPGGARPLSFGHFPRERGKPNCYAIGGRCWIHGWACSKAAEAAKDGFFVVFWTDDLEAYGEAWLIVSLGGVKPAGMEAAGQPVALECMVKAPFQNCSGNEEVPVTEPGNGSLTKAGNRATGARTRSYVLEDVVEGGFQFVYTPQSGGVLGCRNLRAPFHPVLPVCGHLVAVFVQIFGEVVVRGRCLDGAEGVVGFEEGDIDLFNGASEVLEC